jgi:hypothetical protein
MAVRAFDLKPHDDLFEAPVVPATPLAGRRELRRLKKRWQRIGAVSLALPFLAALVAVVVAR